MQRMYRLGQRVFIGLLGLVVGVGMVAPIAASAAPLELTLRGTSTYAGQQTTLRVVLTDDGDPVPGAQVRIQRREGTGWQLVSIVTTDGTGQATTPATMSRNARSNVFRALYPAIGSAQATSERESPTRSTPVASSTTTSRHSAQSATRSGSGRAASRRSQRLCPSPLRACVCIKREVPTR